MTIEEVDEILGPKEYPGLKSTWDGPDGRITITYGHEWPSVVAHIEID